MAGTLANIGVNLGVEFIDEVKEVNERGFWESRELVAINESILDVLGTRWFLPFTVDCLQIEQADPRMVALRERMAQFLSLEFGTSQVIALKDPRMCLLWPFWFGEIRKQGFNPAIILTMRPCAEISASLRARDGITPHHAEALWVDHVVKALEATMHGSSVLVHYQDLLENPAAVIDNIVRTFNLPDWLVEQPNDRFVDPSLRHQHASGKSYWSIVGDLERLLAEGMPEKNVIEDIVARTRQEWLEIKPMMDEMALLFGAYNKKTIEAQYNYSLFMSALDKHEAELKHVKEEKKQCLDTLEVEKDTEIKLLHEKLRWHAGVLSMLQEFSILETIRWKIGGSILSEPEGGGGKRTYVRVGSPMVDVVIPVYRGLDETIACIVTADATVDRNSARIVVINDCSPEPQLATWLRDNSTKYRFQLIENDTNLGFVGTVNRAMRLEPSHDIVLLNSDVEVANNWLERLRQTAYSEPNIGSVTPFSNNATICSFPNICEDNVLPDGFTLAQIDGAFSECVAANSHVEVPTGVGFCMYLRRDCLDAVGDFDERTFGLGYGEENDWCQRAIKSGWKNVHALNVFVYHKGGVSFAEESNPRKKANLDLLIRRYPDYISDVHRFISDDPASKFRLKVLLALARSDCRPKVLLISHGMGGGVRQHLSELASTFADLHFLLLEPAGQNLVHLELNVRGAFKDKLLFEADTDYGKIVHLCRYLGVGHVHFHHTMGLNPTLWSLPADLGTEFDITIHDFYALYGNPTLTDKAGRYCADEVNALQLMKERYPLPVGVDFQGWQKGVLPLITNASRIICPSKDTASRFASVFGSLPQLVIAWHPDVANLQMAVPHFDWQPHKGKLKVLVLGALSLEKGAETLEAAAMSLSDRIEFHLLGYSFRDLDRSVVTHGSYQPKDVEEKIRAINPDVIWFPAQWPETYSYTLSIALKSGLPIAAPCLGAFSERLSGRACTYLKRWPFVAKDWIDWWVSVVEDPSVLTKSTADIEDLSDIDRRFYESRYRKSSWATIVTINQLPPQFDNFLVKSRQRAQAIGKRERLLAMLITLRTHAITKRFARFVPIGIQRAIKRYLSRAPLHDLK